MSGARPPALPARLRPPRPAFPVVDRHRLVDAVAAGVQSAPLTLIRAPAGSGKTVLAAAWATRARRGVPPARLAGPPAWLTLDDGDDRPGVFWSHVIAALSRTGAVVDGAPDPGRDLDPAFVDRLAAELLTHDAPVALVLDQAERLTDRRIGRQLDQLLRAAGPRFRLVMVTRTDPALPLHRYRLDATVAQVRYDDLAFTPAEVAVLLELHGVRTPELTRMVAERTEGWAAGVRFAAMALQDHRTAAAADEVRASLEPDGSVLGEYLAAEVLDALPPAHLDFLTRTSVVAELTPGLAEALSGRRDSERLLAELVRGNAFVLAVPDAAGAYRTHPLVRDLLGTVLARESPGEAVTLHRRAARWFAASGRLTEAVDQLVAAGDWAGAATLVVDGGALAPLLVPGPGSALVGRLERLPADVDTPAAAAVLAALAVGRGEPRRAARRLSRCDERLASLGRGASGSGLALAVAATRTMLADGVGDAGATLAAAGHLLEVVRGATWVDPARLGELRALGLLAAGTARLRDGDPVAACTDLAEAMAALAAAGDEQPGTDGSAGRRASAGGDGAGGNGVDGVDGRAAGPGGGGDDGVDGCAAAIRLRCLGMLALAEASRGRLSRVRELAGAAEALAGESSVAAADRPAAAHLARAWTALQRQDLAGAQHWLRRAVRIQESRDDPLLASVGVLLQVRLRRDQGDADGARRLLERSGTGPAWVRALIDAEAAAVDARRDPTRDATRDTPAAPRPAGIEPQAARVEQLLQQAHRQLARGEAEASRAAVVRALRLAERDGLRRPFTHVSPRVRRLMRLDADVAARADWLRPGGAGPAHTTRAEDEDPDGGVPPGRALSDRELEVLRHLSSLLTTEEVASAMYISVNTVRTHIRGILRKLSASRRNEAVRRARQLGLV
ncbi:LuxR C-terminal-related transcriptional regulator [Jiangella mangrovi]|uniref:LuxR family maltose regulon positive regulatory protein n=1 Tax=Jiangella mangrovi TaxID=1524084 RepID=A0A7W9GWL6_9ACTN|nr:LuxR family maltose regulon positive regulatory protein [Jiangella mangrovi]